MYVKSSKGTRANGNNGWSAEGLNLYNELLVTVTGDRFLHGEKFQERFEAYSRKQHASKSSRKKRKVGFGAEQPSILTEKEASSLFLKRRKMVEDGDAEGTITKFAQI